MLKILKDIIFDNSKDAARNKEEEYIDNSIQERFIKAIEKLVKELKDEVS